MALLTVLAIVGKPFIPLKTLVIHPADGVTAKLYGQSNSDGETPQNAWLDDSQWRCQLPEREKQLYCGITYSWETLSECTHQNETPADACETLKQVTFRPAADGTIDFSAYDGLSLDISYEGRAQYLHVYLQDKNPLYPTIKPDITEKFIAALLRTDDLKTGPVVIRWNQFNVEHWWTMAKNPPLQIAGPEFGHIAVVALGNVEPGVHRIKVNEIQLVGERISDKTYLFTILIIWIVFGLLEATVRYYRLRGALQSQQQELLGLEDNANLLEAEQVQLQSRALTDPLTGVLNRTGIARQLNHRHGGGLLPSHTGLIVLDIDHFKSINDNYGHDVGDAILREFADLIRNEIRVHDLFARWGGEEFILLVEETTTEKLSTLAEKLRQKTASHQFKALPANTITVSIGVVKATDNESFDNLFKRGDKALYKAKLYRNTAVYEWLE